VPQLSRAGTCTAVTEATGDDPPYARATVVCTDWEYWDQTGHAPTSTYSVGVTGRAGSVLADLLDRHGPVRVVFSGRQTIRHLPDGTTALEVEAEHVGVDPEDERAFPLT